MEKGYKLIPCKESYLGLGQGGNIVFVDQKIKEKYP